MNFLHYLKHAVPTDIPHAIGAAMLALIGFLFPAPAIIYQSFLMLVMIDTLTGVGAALTRGTFNSRSWRTKMLPKILTYLTVPTALWTFGNFLDGTALAGIFVVASQFTLASIALIELTSILENGSVMLGKRITLKWDAKELMDLMEANHVRDNTDARYAKPLPKRKPRNRKRVQPGNKPEPKPE